MRSMKRKMCWLAFGVTIVYFLVIFFFWKPAYYINDDWIIRDIFSGRYSGTADAHVYTVNYLFASFFVFLYKVIPQVDWWGTYLCASMVGCFFAILHSTLQRMERRHLAGIIFVSCVFTAASLYSTIAFTYTTTGAMLGTTALFLLLVCRRLDWKHMIFPLLLLVLAFCTRQDTFYMTFPLCVLVVLLKKISLSGRRGWISATGFCGMLLFSVGILHGVHRYQFMADPEWKTFLEFRDLRMRVHDYTGYPDWNASENFYKKLGLSQEEYHLIRPGSVNTAFDIDPEIRVVLKEVGEYGITHQNDVPLMARILGGIKNIGLNLCREHVRELLVVGMMVLLMIIIAIMGGQNDLKIMLLTDSLFCLEIAYLGYRGRYTYAVGNAMVTMLIWGSLACFVDSLTGDTYSGNKKRVISVIEQAGITAICIGLVICSLLQIPRLREINDTLKERYTIRRQIDDYCRKHIDNHYFEPAFSISNMTYALEGMDKRFNNLIVLGGWNFSSPEYENVMKAFGLAGSREIEEALLTKDRFFIISTEGMIEVIIQYFKWKYGDQLQYSVIDRVADHSNVYSFTLVQ